MQSAIAKEDNHQPDSKPAKSNIWSNRNELPEWCFMHHYSSDSIWMMGISDPGLGREMAYVQAMIRLKTVLAMCIATDIELQQDFFEGYEEELQRKFNAKDDSKFIRLLRFRTKQFIISENIQIVDSTTTEYGELILKAVYPLSIQTSDSSVFEEITSNTDLFFIEYGLRTHYGNELLLHMHSTVEPDSISYKLIKSAERAEILSHVNQIPLPFKTDYYKYFSPHETINNTASPESKLFYGLWKAFIESLFLNLSQNIVSGENLTKHITEMHRTEEAFNKRPADKMNRLSREFSQQNLSFFIRKLHISENRLWLDIQFKQN